MYKYSSMVGWNEDEIYHQIKLNLPEMGIMGAIFCLLGGTMWGKYWTGEEKTLFDNLWGRVFKIKERADRVR
jgi:hypothetical protein